MERTVVCPKPEQSRTFPYLIMNLATYVTKAYIFSLFARLLLLVAAHNSINARNIQ